MIPLKTWPVSQTSQTCPVLCNDSRVNVVVVSTGTASKLSASVGLPNRAVNLNLMSYIRHTTPQFLLDERGVFVMKSCPMMNPLPPPASQATAPASAGVAPTFSPLYQQIKVLITASLQAGEWKPGELIPSEVELASRFKVSQGTVRKAIDELSAENLVVRRQGKGTFVATHHEVRAQFRFLRLMPDTGIAHQADNLIIEVKRQRAPADVARLLDMKPADAVIFIKRVQSFDGAPAILEELWLPGTIFKGLTSERLVEYKGPMYGLFETEFGTRMIRAAEKIRAVHADHAACGWLQVPIDTPLLSVERVSFTYGDKPVEVRRGLYRTDNHHYQSELI
jgi:GntR family transcriptional regulator